MKYTDYMVGFREFPDEITLLINISGCPNHCPDCHSKYLWEDVGDELTTDVLDKLIEENKGITCIGFMGGDQDPKYIVELSKYIKEKYKNLSTGWYSGQDKFPLYHGTFNYIKLGPYIKEKGSLENPDTNQRLYMITGCGNELNAAFVDITHKFWDPKPWNPQYFKYEK